MGIIISSFDIDRAAAAKLASCYKLSPGWGVVEYTMRTECPLDVFDPHRPRHLGPSKGWPHSKYNVYYCEQRCHESRHAQTAWWRHVSTKVHPRGVIPQYREVHRRTLHKETACATYTKVWSTKSCTSARLCNSASTHRPIFVTSNHLRQWR